MTQANARPPRLASTLILLSAHPESHTVMVALLRRSRSARFLPGALVFPGGALEPEDERYLAPVINEDEVQRALADHQEWGFESKQAAARSLGAALRETEEEAGVSLFAMPATINMLRCVGHWLTPEALKTRFDTYFWAAELHGEAALSSLDVDGVEIERGEWQDPREVLRAYERAELDLPAPTLCILSELVELIEQRPNTHVGTCRSTLVSELIETLNQDQANTQIKVSQSFGRILLSSDDDGIIETI